jgi:hypothetical protein
MDHTDARRRNHWVSHIARHPHAKPGAVYLRFEGASVTWAQIHERVGADAHRTPAHAGRPECHWARP